MGNPIRYRSGYKYQLAQTTVVHTWIMPPQDLKCAGFLRLDTATQLTIERGYAWDGPSGPSIDSKNFMRASLVHDALYQMMRLQVLDRSCKGAADRLLRKICRADGMSAFRAWYVYHAVRVFGADAATNVKLVEQAP